MKKKKIDVMKETFLDQGSNLLSKNLLQRLFSTSSFLYSWNVFFRLTYLLFFGLIKKQHLLYLNDKILIARGKNTSQQKISAMLISLLISYDKDREVRDLYIHLDY